MLKNETEYRRAVEEVTEQRGRLEQQIERHRREGLSDEQVRLAMEPLWAYHRQLAGEIERYERIKRGEFDVLRNLERLGELLIAVRIYLGLTQAELAERLGLLARYWSVNEPPPALSISAGTAGAAGSRCGSSVSSRTSTSPRSGRR